MSTVLTATHRLSMTYIVDGFQHVARAYCKRQDPLIGGPGLLNRDGTSLTSVVDAAQGWWDALCESLGGAVPAPNILFEERSGVLWFPIMATTPTSAGPSGTIYPAAQMTLVVRDTAFKKIRVVTMEGRYGYVGHSPTGLGITGGLDLVANAYNGVGLGSHDPYEWQKSRGDNYILASGAIAGMTLDLNDKLKRRRGLE